MIKAYFRAAKAFFALDKLEAAYKSCEKVIELDENNCEAVKLLELVKKRIKYYLDLEAEKERKKKESLFVKDAIKTRGVVMSSAKTPVMLPCPRHQLPSVRIAGSNLIWPVLFLYPFYDLSDFISGFNEQDSFSDHLQTMLSPTPRWDTYQKYKDKSALKIYWKNSSGKLKPIAQSETLGSLLKSAGKEMVAFDDGILVFYIVRLISEIK